MLRAYKYRIYPSHAQKTRLAGWLALCCELYNAGLQERRDAYRIARKTIAYKDQQNQLPEIKRIRPELSTIHSQVLQDVLRRLDKAFDAFFRRVKRGEKPGFPRFRSRSRYNCFTFSQTGFAIETGKLRLSKVGRVRIKLHRPLKGKIKTLTITRSSTGKWFACFAVENEPEPLPPVSDAVGIDCGLERFARLSNGEHLANPRFFRRDEKRLVKAQKRLSAATKGSRERKKRRIVVAHVHERIANKRRDFAHKESRKLVYRFSIIVFEDLNIRVMLKNHSLAKSIADAAWNQLNPRNTSQICSGCGEIVEKDLSVRLLLVRAVD